MRRQIPFIFLIVLGVGTLSCRKDYSYKKLTPIIPIDPGKEYVEFYTTKENVKRDTKAFLDTEFAFWWKGDDSISVFDGFSSTINVFKIKGGENTKTAVLYGQVDERWQTFYAVAPHGCVSFSEFYFEQGKALVTLPVQQKICSGLIMDRSAIVSMAKVVKSDGYDIGLSATPFYDACSYIIFKFAADNVSEVTVKSLNNEQLAGKFSLTKDADSVKVEYGSFVEQSDSVRLVPPQGSTYFTKDANIVIPVIAPPEFNFTGGFRFTFVKNGERYFAPYPVDTHLPRTHGLNLGDLCSDKKCKALNSAPDIVKGIVDATTKISLTFSWAESDSNSTQVSNYYTVGLYKNAACAKADLVGTEVVNKKDTELGATSAGARARKEWSGLTPDTQYWCKVQNTYNGKCLIINGKTLPVSGSINNMSGTLGEWQ